MPAEAFSYVIEPGDGVTVVRMSGDIVKESGAGFDSLGAEISGPVLLDFADVGFINSSGIALIVGILAKARAENRPVSACGLTDHYRHIFEITRLSDFMDIYDDEAAAAVSR